ncbi:hypothetical protein RRU01S_04_01440 [Agrobacterium rubi TR3 = NBRC 13261]|uniref:Phage replication protein n=1 Tax=Agrobacterium rubi TR3 = NBRC 13261 TaxID=1368415 RepID=A0A081CRM6_9HYPH|nr:helix-turn-helix domain-containing protein [Agrobacterium rubi]MBP1876869.1 hypothetical protein [Agrobacterium rubi]GAK69322.1 hypothetical protein RRU01S_04_01440 [Agrobacterium rubi TR3 = NBRC 13261]
MNKLRKPPSGFTMVPNALIRSDALSLKAKGLYCLLFSKPDNWIYMEDALVNESADGRDSYRSGIKELIETGWLIKVQVRDDKGVFSHIDWHLSDDGQSADGKPVAGQSPTSNTDENKTDREIPSVSPKPKTKASPRANPATSIAITLQGLASIPTEFIDRAASHDLSVLTIDDEWAKFRNHHISARSKHTRIDLCWDTWCRNAARWQSRGAANAGGGAGHGSHKRHDPVAAARDRTVADLFGVGAKGHGGATADADTSPDPFGSREDAIDASFVDVGAGNETIDG